MSGYFKITTFGCQMNKSDSERLKSLLAASGLSEAADDDSADLLVYNTCSVRQTAEDRIYGVHHALQARKEKNPDLLVDPLPTSTTSADFAVVSMPSESLRFHGHPRSSRPASS